MDKHVLIVSVFMNPRLSGETITIISTMTLHLIQGSSGLVQTIHLSHKKLSGIPNLSPGPGCQVGILLKKIAISLFRIHTMVNYFNQ